MRFDRFGKSAFFPLFLVLFCAFLSSCASDGGIAYPSPSRSFYVYDRADMLSDETESYLIEKNKTLREECGAQIVIACIPTTGGADITDYACGLFNKWKIGDREKNNGILLLLSKEEDDYWIVQGKGLESILTSGILKMMLNEHLEGPFSIGNYDLGVVSLFDELVSHLEAAYAISISEGSLPVPEETVPLSDVQHSETTQNPARSSLLSSVFVALLIGVLILIAVVVILIVVVVAIVRIVRKKSASSGIQTPRQTHSNKNPYSAQKGRTSPNGDPARQNAPNGGYAARSWTYPPSENAGTASGRQTPNTGTYNNGAHPANPNPAGDTARPVSRGPGKNAPGNFGRSAGFSRNNGSDRN